MIECLYSGPIYPAFKAHAHNCIVISRRVWLYHILFSQYVTNGTIFGKKGFEHKTYVFVPLETFFILIKLSEIFS